MDHHYFTCWTLGGHWSRGPCRDLIYRVPKRVSPIPFLPRRCAAQPGTKAFPDTVLYHTMLCCTTLLYCSLLYSTVLCSTLLYSTLLYFTLLYSTLLYSTLLNCTIPYRTITLKTILCCIPRTALQCQKQPGKTAQNCQHMATLKKNIQTSNATCAN